MAASSSQEQSSIHVHQLEGISGEDASVLLQTQQALLAGGGSSSSRAASRASSDNHIVMTVSALRQMDHYFQRALEQIRVQIDYLTQESEYTTQLLSNMGADREAEVDAALARLDQMEAELDGFDHEFARLANLHGIVKGLRQRAADRESAMSQSSSRHSSSRHHHSSHRHGHSGSSRHHRH